MSNCVKVTIHFSDLTKGQAIFMLNNGFPFKNDGVSYDNIFLWAIANDKPLDEYTNRIDLFWYEIKFANAGEVIKFLQL